MPGFEGFSQQTFDFIWNLRLNNERLWFEAHKDEYLKYFAGPMKALGNDVFERIMSDFEGRNFLFKVSRIYKDARRVRGGDPYRTNLWFSIEAPSEEWTSTPVFWFELAPENWSYGLGYYSARPETMAKLRVRIDRDPNAFEKIVAPLARQSEFIMDGPEYKRKKEAPTPKTAPWYNRKSFSLIHEQPNGEELFSPQLTDRLVAGYTFLMPFYDYFITLDADPAPKKA